MSMERKDGAGGVGESGEASGWQLAAAGAGAGFVTRALCQPLDVIKIRFQLQVEPIATGSKYSSSYQAVQTILREEKITALWSGHIPAQYLSISYGLVYFWTYEILYSKCYSYNRIKQNIPNYIINFTCGAVAGGFATFISFPFDTIRTRIVAEDKRSKVYRGVWHTGYQMYTTEGKLSLFRGLLPTAAQIAPHSGAQFMFYKIFSEYFNVQNDVTILSSLSAGSMAGLLSKLFIYPFDLAKKRMQLQGFQPNRVDFGKQFYCNGFIDCVLKTMKHEGFFALYKGLYPSLVKAVLVTSLHFTFFEQFCKVLRNLNSN